MEHTISNYKGELLGKKVSSCNCTEVTLKGQDLFKLDGNRRGIHMDVTEGVIWITQAGDNEDYLLQPGQSFIVSHPGMVLAQGSPQGKILIL